LLTTTTTLLLVLLRWVNVVLLEDLNDKGFKGDELPVKPGFARNFLIPGRKAVYATPVNKEKYVIEKTVSSREEEEGGGTGVVVRGGRGIVVVVVVVAVVVVGGGGGGGRGVVC